MQPRVVKSLLAMQHTQVQSLGWEHPLEEGMATHSSILAGNSCMDRGAWWARVHRVAKSWALGSPIFPSGCEGKLEVALESLQGLRDLT